MILVPNLRQLLNGNSLSLKKDRDNYFSLLLFLTLLFFTSCDSLKKVQQPDSKQETEGELEEIQGKRVFNPETGEYEIVTDVTGTLDTIRWTDASIDEAPPITSEATQQAAEDANEDSEFYGSYNVAIALPFLSDRFDEIDQKIDPRSLPALNFYEGIKMAFDVLSGEGINLDVSVVDTKASETRAKLLTDNYDLLNAQLIIGAFRNSTARVFADFAKKNKKTFISPFYPHQNLTIENPYFIQVNPSEKTHAEAIMKHVKENFQNDQIVLLSRNTAQEQNIMQHYQNAHFMIEGSTIVAPLRVLTIADESSSLEEIDLSPYIDPLNATAFVITSSSQSFVYAVLRKLDLDKEQNAVVVYGQPRWKDFTQISYDYYEAMNVHISAESYLDPDSYEIQSFKQGFYNKYGMPPTEEAFKGYDIMLYFGRMIKQFGTGFRNSLDKNSDDYLHTRFDFQRTVTSPKIPSEGQNLNLFDQYENKFVNILEFEGYQFKKAD